MYVITSYNFIKFGGTKDDARKKQFRERNLS